MHPGNRSGAIALDNIISVTDFRSANIHRGDAEDAEKIVSILCAFPLRSQCHAVKQSSPELHLRALRSIRIVGHANRQPEPHGTASKMSSPSSSQQWIHLGLFAAAGVAVFGLLYFLVEAVIPPAEDHRAYYAGVFMFAGEQFVVDPGLPQEDFDQPKADGKTARTAENFLSLPLEEPRRVGRIQLIYRGLSNGNRFRIDVVIPELDPNRAYPRALSVDEAEKAFTLTGERFRLLSANEYFLHLEKLP